ncbi:MAG: ribosome silencing factor [Phormidium sp. GEM2.Bin31]|nr:ribosome silencing factor [Phormidium sp. BM_Day4_Bin.17]TVR05666.1 MAG: ribosome silencing factor [Phormidium sp. GEM2.Bin31]UCJ12370.1 MAG: ribosome silencing factor [Phormidium sp. PBR-2020]
MTEKPHSPDRSSNPSVSEAERPPISGPDKTSESYQLVIAAVQGAEDRKGDNITVLRVEEVSYLADYFIIVTGFSRVQVRAIAQAVQAQVELDLDRNPVRVEGLSEGIWVLQDYGDVLVHILMPEEREFYNLEAFWGHAERIDISSLFPSRVSS